MSVKFRTLLISGILIAGACAVSLVFLPRDRQRTVFYFHSLESEKLYSEVRYLPKDPYQGETHQFVEELILGPMTNRYVRLFSEGTGLDFCFEKDGVLYVGLTKDALKFTPEIKDIEGSVNLLKQNIVTRFTKINSVLVYIDGKSVC